MVKSSSLLPGAGVGGHGALDWVRAISPRRVGILALTLAFLLTIASYVLQETLNYPAILLDRPALAQALVAHGGLAALLGFFGLLLIVITLGLEPSLETATRGRVTLAGVASGACWAVGGLLGLALVPLWAGANTRAAPALAAIVLALAEIAAPLLLALWTLALARQFRAYRVLGWVGAIGLLVAAWRSLLWGLNALLPIASGFYGTADILSVLAVVGVSFWLLWLLRLGFRLMARDAAGETPAPPAAAAAESAASTSTSTESTGTLHRWRVLRGALGLGVGLAGAAFVGGRTGFTIAASPELEGDDIPAEPSLIAAGYYLLALMLFKIIHPVNTVAALASQVPSTDITPPPPNRALAQIGALIEPVDANGVPAERISAPGVSSSRWLLYIHGGGWAVPWTNDNRAFVGRLCKGASVTALYPNYRLIPEHPFPAALNDCVATYRWLRQQGVPASHIVIAGESAGGNLTLATALALKESGDELPDRGWGPDARCVHALHQP